MAPRPAQLAFFIGTLALLQAQPRIVAAPIACTTGTIAASVTPVEPAVSLQCGNSAAVGGQALQPEFCAYEGERCKDESPTSDVSTIFQTLEAEGKWATNTLSITAFPKTKNEKICLLCRDAGTVRCKVVVSIPEDARSCSREAEKPTNLDLTLAQNETVYFRCPNGDVLSPAEGAYEEDCQTAATLPSGLVRKDNKEAHAYSLTLGTAPEAEKTFCYVCGAEPREKAKAQECFVKVTTQAKTQTPTQTTTQATTRPPGGSPTTSGTVTSQLSVTLGCGLALTILRYL